MHVTDLTLYWLIPKDRSSRVRWLLRELDVEFSEKKMDASPHFSRRFRLINVVLPQS